MVARALALLNKEKKTWKLENVCPEIKRRGHSGALSPEDAECVVRCELGDEMGQGFFVCVFVKCDTPSKERKVEKKEKKPKKQKTKENLPVDYANRAKTMRFVKRGKKVPLGISYSIVCLSPIVF